MKPLVSDDALCLRSIFEKEILTWQKGSRQKGDARWTSDWNEIGLPLKEPLGPLGMTPLGVMRET